MNADIMVILTSGKLQFKITDFSNRRVCYSISGVNIHFLEDTRIPVHVSYYTVSNGCFKYVGTSYISQLSHYDLYPFIGDNWSDPNDNIEVNSHALRPTHFLRFFETDIKFCTLITLWCDFEPSITSLHGEEALV